jgi:copper chaperone CopZ
MTTITYHIADMHCSACVMRLEGLEDDLAGVRSARASYHRQELVIDYDEQVLTEETIIARIHQLGYTPSPIST